MRKKTRNFIIIGSIMVLLVVSSMVSFVAEIFLKMKALFMKVKTSPSAKKPAQIKFLSLRRLRIK